MTAPPIVRPAVGVVGAPAAVRILEDEHLAIASVLWSLRATVRALRGRGGAPDFRVLEAMLDYIVEFPEKLHHPKEDRFLFTALAARCPGARKLTSALAAEHHRGAAMIAELATQLGRYRDIGAAGLESFAGAVDAYADFHWQHMRREEEVLLPLALGHLTDADWVEIGEAFRDNDNPLAGLKPREHAEALYLRILERAFPASTRS